MPRVVVEGGYNYIPPAHVTQHVGAMHTVGMVPNYAQLPQVAFKLLVAIVTFIFCGAQMPVGDDNT